MPLPGTGEISFDPQFVNPAAYDFSLVEGSPCIDAGDPSILDPDGTPSDMGAVYSDQAGGDEIVTRPLPRSTGKAP